jgi:hypothetical protein
MSKVLIQLVSSFFIVKNAASFSNYNLPQYEHLDEVKYPYEEITSADIWEFKLVEK